MSDNNLILVSSSGNSAVLRTESNSRRFSISGTPLQVLVVPAYIDYTIEFPSVDMTYVRVDGVSVTEDVSKYVSCNHPNPETPGLYKLTFMLTMPGETPVMIWESWVSIEEPPLLRGTISPWMRENRTISDLNRLVVEPQFQEALYMSGAPLYNFTVANMPNAISATTMKHIKGSLACSLGTSIFLSGPMFPVGTELRSGSDTYVLKTSKLSPVYAPGREYHKYDVVSYGSTCWMVTADNTYTIPGGDDWIEGNAYGIDGTVPAEGQIQIDSLWVNVDADGYLFRVDVKTYNTIGHYWGHYDPKHFYDYAPGDLVSLVSDNVLYLYRRNESDTSQLAIEESYRPGNYRNPHWDEVYSATTQGVLRTPTVTPITNASNSLVSKTGSVMDSMFRIYAHMANIPSEIIDGLGLKKGVLIWAILYRTRNTYFGFKAAANALGINIDTLYRVYPSIAYYADGSDTPITDVYDEIGKCKEMAKSIKAGRLLVNGASLPTPLPADAGTVPYIRYKENADGTSDTVEKYNVVTQSWTEFYRFEKLSGDFNVTEWDFTKNNRYYRAEVSFLDRLAQDSTIDMGDGEEWLSDEAFSPISVQLAALFEYEIPIYIYLKMFVRLASVGHMTRIGVMGGAVCHDASGGDIELRLYPSKLFDPSSVQVKEFWPVVTCSDTSDGSYDVAIYDVDTGTNYRRYRFDHAKYLKFTFSEGMAFAGYWVSPHSVGMLTGTANPLLLANGAVGATIDFEYTSNIAASVEAYKWNYILGTWAFDGVDIHTGTPFAEYKTIPATFIAYWNGTVVDFINSIDFVSSPTTNVVYTKELISDGLTDSSDDNIITSDSDVLVAITGGVLFITGKLPSVLNLWHGANIIGTFSFVDLSDVLPVESVPSGSYMFKITFTEADA